VQVTARTRIELARRPWIRWLVVVSTAVGAWITIDGAKASLDRRIDVWGTPIDVVVAVTDVAAGTPLETATERRTYPAALVPATARRTIGDGDLASRTVAAGAIITDVDVAGATRDELVPAGWVVVTIREAVPSGVRRGDVVVVAADGLALTDDARVVEVVDDLVTLAVEPAAGPVVAASTTSSTGPSLLVRP
jgi:hypothetical protein